MTHDPFDRLRDANPVPEESLPPAPMQTAERILGRRSSRAAWPGWAVAAAAAIAVLVAGGAWMLWLGGGDDEITAADPSTAIAAASSSTTATTTEAASPVTPPTTHAWNFAPTRYGIVYLLQEGPTGPVLVPVPRTMRDDSDPEWALESLLLGPMGPESSMGLSSAIPDGIDGPTITMASWGDGTAVVRVPQNWVDFGYPTPDGLAQIVFTLTRIDGVDAVGFLLGDDEVRGGVVAGTGELIPEDEFGEHPFVDAPVTRLTFEGWMPLAFLESPAFGAEVSLPATASGFANSIGNQVRLTLEVDERTLWQETVTGTCGTPWSECRGEWDWSSWSVDVPDVGYGGGGANLIVEAFGSGVEIIDRRTYPLTVLPPETPPGLAEAPSELAVYLLVEADATHTTPGPHLIPAAWTTAILSAPLEDPVRQAMEWLLLSPLPGWREASPSLTSAIPERTRLLGLEVIDGVAVVDLSSEFVTGGGSLSMRARLAQVVFTLTRFEEVDAVRFLIDGRPTSVFGGEGVVVGDPVTPEGFGDLLPPIMIEDPVYGSFDRTRPQTISGTADVFEGTVSLAVTDAEGLILWEGFATASCGTGCRGDWSVEVPVSAPADRWGAVIAWEESPRDGSQTNVREHPVWPASPEPPGDACSGTGVPAELPVQDGLPDAVATLRADIFAAARSCDWEALTLLIGPNTNTSFGPPDDPIARWQAEEDAGLRPMWWLAQTLRMPAAVASYEGGLGWWTWPSANGYGSWDEVPEADREALLALYTEDDLTAFEEWGAFFLYRVGITPEGEWAYYVTGD